MFVSFSERYKKKKKFSREKNTGIAQKNLFYRSSPPSPCTRILLHGFHLGLLSWHVLLFVQGLMVFFFFHLDPDPWVLNLKNHAGPTACRRGAMWNKGAPRDLIIFFFSRHQVFVLFYFRRSTNKDGLQKIMRGPDWENQAGGAEYLRDRNPTM